MKETERIAVLEELAQKRIKQHHASRKLGISVRQVRRMLKRYKQDGAKGLVHKRDQEIYPWNDYIIPTNEIVTVL